MGWLQRVFGLEDQADFCELVRQGAEIIDVRSSGEFRTGHIAGSRNVPLGELEVRLRHFPKDKVVILCCASGARSRMAKQSLKRAGFSAVHNGGSWHSLKQKIK